MSIKVCKQKFEKRAGFVVNIILQFFVFLTTGIVIFWLLVLADVVEYTSYMSSHEGFGWFLFGLIGGVFSHVFALSMGVHYLQYIAKHQKVFEWNRDC